MNLNMLNWFMSVASGKTLEETATDSFVSPSALSKALKKLEDEVGCPLFDRSGRKAKLTPAGEHYYHRLQQILGDYSTLLMEMERFKSNKCLNICACPSFSDLSLNVLMMMYSTWQPNVSVNEYDSRIEKDVISKLLTGAYDFVFAHDSSYIRSKSQELVLESFRKDRLVLVCSKMHTLSIKSEVSVTELMGERILVSRYVYDKVKTVFPQIPPGNFQINTSRDIPFKLYSNQGLSIMFEGELYSLHSSEVAIIRIKELDYVNIYLIYNKQQHLLPHQQAFLDKVIAFRNRPLS